MEKKTTIATTMVGTSQSVALRCSAYGLKGLGWSVEDAQHAADDAHFCLGGFHGGSFVGVKVFRRQRRMLRHRSKLTIA